MSARIRTESFWIFLSSEIQSGEKKRTLEDSAWNLFTFTLLIFRTKQGAWHKRIQLKRGSDFPSTRTSHTVRLILGLQYSVENPTRHTYSSARIASNEPVYFEGWNKFSDSIRSPWEPNLTHRWRLSYRRRKRFSSSVGLLFRSEFSDRRHNTGFGDKSIVFLHFPQKFRVGQLSLLSINFDFQNVIFQPMLFPFVWVKYKWKFMRDRYRLSFPQPLEASPLAQALSRGSRRSPK